MKQIALTRLDRVRQELAELIMWRVVFPLMPRKLRSPLADAYLSFYRDSIMLKAGIDIYSELFTMPLARRQ